LTLATIRKEIWEKPTKENVETKTASMMKENNLNWNKIAREFAGDKIYVNGSLG
jgi:hypothetical protein